MSKQPPQAAEHERLEELATGFALGDLNQAELTELHEQLQGDKPAARQAAATCWSALETTVDLRAAMDHSLPDTVVHRIANPNPHSFISSVFGRLGFSRPRLKPITTAKSQDSGPGLRPAPFLIASAITIMLLVILWLLWPSPVQYSVRELGGVVRLAGTQVQLGATVANGLLTVPAGGRMVLAPQAERN